MSNASPVLKKPCFEITLREIEKFKDCFPAHHAFLLQCVKNGFFKIVPEEQVSRP